MKKIFKMTISVLALSVFLSIIFASLVFAEQKDILILLSDTRGAPLNKNTNLYDPVEWYKGNNNNPYKVDKLLQLGWSLLQIAPVNPEQCLWIFVK
jgi:hypothetical protein